MKWLLLRPARLARLGAVACALAAAPTVAKADQIDRVLIADSGTVTDKVVGLKAKHVAVLPFQVQIGNQPATFKQGVEGLQLANKLQNILVAGNPVGKPGEYVVLTDAAKRAAEAGKRMGKPIDWTSAAGRNALLNLKLPVAWDDSKVLAPDTYLTGTLKVSANLKDATLYLSTFSRANPELKPLVVLKESAKAGIRVDRNTLADLGKSFAVSKRVLTKSHPNNPVGRAKAAFEPDEAASDSAVAMMAPPAVNGALVVPGCPVELTVLVNGQPTAIASDGSNNFRMGQTPPPGSNLSFNLVNRSDKPVAVVLAIDGNNVIQLNPDEKADQNNNREKWRKFVLQPATEVPLYTVSGFRRSLTGDADSRITVDTEESSAARFEAMAPAVRGKIEMMVFPANEGVSPNLTTPSDGGSTTPTNTTVDPNTDALAQTDQATDASGIEQLDKTMGRTRSAKVAQQKVLSRLPQGTTLAAAKKGGMKIEMPKPKVMGKTKGLVLADGGSTYASGGTTEQTFVTAPSPSASIQITYYSPEMVGGQPTPAAPGGN